MNIKSEFRALANPVLRTIAIRVLCFRLLAIIAIILTLPILIFTSLAYMFTQMTKWFNFLLWPLQTILNSIDLAYTRAAELRSKQTK